jgi:hypothetical protein
MTQDAGPTPAELAERMLALSDVTHVQADEGSGAPQISWGDRFFFVGADRRRPFATIVEHDTPGFDEDSRLDRSGVFRLSIEFGREHPPHLRRTGMGVHPQPQSFPPAGR